MASSIPARMKAIRILAPGEKASLELAEIDTPRPGPGEILLKVEAAGVNRGDLMQVMGLYPPPPGAPETMGLEAAGAIAAIGQGVTRWNVGDRACVLVAGGGYAEYCVAHEGSVLPVPKDFTFIEGAALPEAYCTVWTNIVDRARLQPGESLLVHGGASGIGTVAVALFALRGHRVFTTAGDPKKTALCEELGATRAINYREEDFVAVVKQETSGKGVDVILDMVGGDYIQRNIDTLARDGRLVNIAYQKGAGAHVNFLAVMLKRLTITGSTLRARPNAEKSVICDTLRREVWPEFDKGRLRPVIDSTFPLSKTADAHARMAKSAHAGKIVLIP